MGYFDFYHNELTDQQIDELHGIMATHEAAGMRPYDAALQAVRDKLQQARENQAEVKRLVFESISKKEIDAGAHQSATSPKNDLPEPTPAQQAAGNYPKGSIYLYGLDIAIENPEGSTRKGVSPDGKAWTSRMYHHYGFVRRTKGADGDQVDVFVGSQPNSEKVFVVDQVNPDGKFDEHKVMLAFRTLADARKAYLKNYEEGWQGLGAITEMSVDEFKEWLKDGDTLKPVDGAILEAAGNKRTDIQRNLSEALQQQDFKDVNFGTLSKAKLSKINEIREVLKQPILQHNELVIPGNVVRKMYEKRMLSDGMSADEVADVLFSIFHGGKTKVTTSKHDHIQTLVNGRDKLSHLGFIGMSNAEITVVKSGQKIGNIRLDKQVGNKKTIVEGRPTPSSGTDILENADLPRQPGLTDHHDGCLLELSINAGPSVAVGFNQPPLISQGLKAGLDDSTLPLPPDAVKPVLEGAKTGNPILKRSNWSTEGEQYGFNDELYSADYVYDEDTPKIFFNKRGLIVGTSKSEPYKIQGYGKSYPNMKQAIEAVTEIVESKSKIPAYDYRTAIEQAKTFEDIQAVFARVFPAIRSASTTQKLHTFPNEEDGVAAIVAKVSQGYSVVLKDTDADEIAQTAKICSTEDEAVAYAKQIAGIKR